MDDTPILDYTATVDRPRWHELPAVVQDAIGQAAGAQVAATEHPPGSGFTGGFAAVVHLVDGRSVFAKAGSGRNPHLLGAYAQEALVLRELPVGVPAPRLIGAGHVPAASDEDYEWRIVVTEVAEGQIPQPWDESRLAAVHAACLASARALTPAPAGLDLPRLDEALGQNPSVLECFGRLASGELALTTGQPTWLPGRLTDLERIVESAAVHLAGPTACHFDLRADNILVGPRGAQFVDWNWLAQGAAWTDFVGVLPLARADGVDVDTWLATSPLTRGVSPAAVDAWLAAIAAYMLRTADEPVWPGGTPLVRVHQRRYARTFLDWLGARRGWDVA